jgi:hypothetical protein
MEKQTKNHFVREREFRRQGLCQGWQELTRDQTAQTTLDGEAEGIKLLTRSGFGVRINQWSIVYVVGIGLPFIFLPYVRQA